MWLDLNLDISLSIVLSVVCFQMLAITSSAAKDILAGSSIWNKTNSPSHSDKQLISWLPSTIPLLPLVFHMMWLSLLVLSLRMYFNTLSHETVCFSIHYSMFSWSFQCRFTITPFSSRHLLLGALNRDEIWPSHQIAWGIIDIEMEPRGLNLAANH